MFSERISLVFKKLRVFAEKDFRGRLQAIHDLAVDNGANCAATDATDAPGIDRGALDQPFDAAAQPDLRADVEFRMLLALALQEPREPGGCGHLAQAQRTHMAALDHAGHLAHAVLDGHLAAVFAHQQRGVAHEARVAPVAHHCLDWVVGPLARALQLHLTALALSDVARAKGMAQVAKDAGLGRESLYKALAPGAKPRFETVMKVARALGVKFTAQPV